MPAHAPDATPFLELGELAYAALEVWLGGWMQPEVRREKARQRLQALIQIARARAPFYTRLYRDLPDGRALALAELPVVTKQALMADVTASLTDRSITRAELDAFVADHTRIGDLLRGRYAVWTSSGTSGEPGLFLHDRRAVATYEALETLRFRGLASFADYGARVVAGERFALVMVTGGHFAAVSSAEHLRNAFPWLAASVAPFSLLVPLPLLVAQLNDYRPTLLGTYPTAAELLACEQEAGRLHLRLSEIWTGGEYLAPRVKARLEQVFQCRVRNGYGASEFLSIAWECNHGTLHMNDDWVLLEPVDESYRPVPAGTPSYTTLLTNLANEVQPLLRFDLGDSITLLPPCGCGSTLPALRVEGRHDDVLRFADEHGRAVNLLPLVLTTVIEEQADVYDFQLTQTGAHSLRVAVGGADRAAGERVRQVLAAHFADQRLCDITIEVDPVAPRRSPISGKLRRVVCTFAEHERHARAHADGAHLAGTHAG
jgi:phenylacetate-coenzyme A ligase PaaK-like adenylate-forming protein